MSEDIVIWNKDSQDAFVTLVMNRPDKMNAMNQELGDALEDAIRRAVEDPDIRAVVLTGPAALSRRASTLAARISRWMPTAGAATSARTCAA